MKNAIVTGSSKSIGYALADRLLSLGYTVYLNGRKEEALDRAAKLLAEKHGDPSRVGTILGDATDLEKMVASIEEIGSVDVFVNNAGLMTWEKDVPDTTEARNAAFRRSIEINEIGPNSLTTYLIDRSRKTGNEIQIVNVLSTAAFGFYDGNAFYGPSKKGALMALLHKEMTAPGSVRISYIHPGTTLGDGTADAIKSGAISNEMQSARYIAEALETLLTAEKRHVRIARNDSGEVETTYFSLDVSQLNLMDLATDVTSSTQPDESRTDDYEV